MHVGCVKALGEPAVDLGQHLVCCVALALLLPEPGQAGRRTQFPGAGVLGSRYRQGLLEAGFSLFRMRPCRLRTLDFRL